jgi:hypothetical protein
MGFSLAACGDTALQPIADPPLDAGEGDAAQAPVGATPPKCVAGLYEGETRGTYRPSAVGVGGVIAPLSDDNHRTKLRFGLRSDDTEFYRITNGCVHASDIVNGMALAENGIYLFTGQVNCTTGRLSGEMRGYYTALNITTLANDKFYLRGTIAGTFDPGTQSFVDTSYEVHEPKVLIGEQPGGSGTWSVRLVPDAGVLDDQSSCFPEPFPDQLFD